MEDTLNKIAELSKKEYEISEEEVRILIKLVSSLVKTVLVNDGHDPRSVLRLTTKLRDAGRRSPPWNAFSKRVPGRPQDGADGNRQLRWLFDSKHKFYATEVKATLVEVKYYLEVLSMDDAPVLPNSTIRDKFLWLTGHQIIPGAYLDPIQLTPMNLSVIMSDLRQIHSGHYNPLDRGGRHEPINTFLILARSNQLQGNQTVEELLNLMAEILKRHEAKDSALLLK